MVQIQESKKLFQLFLGGPGHLVHETLKSAEEVYGLSYNFLHADCDAIIFVKANIILLTFKCQFIAVLLGRPLVVAGKIP